MAEFSKMTRRAALETIAIGAGAVIASSCVSTGRQEKMACAGRELHHFGIPTAQPQKKEKYMADAKLYVTEVADSPNRIEFLRFEAGSPLPELLQKCSHIAYKVKDLKTAMEGKQVLMQPFSPAPGLKVAFVVEEGIPIELMQQV